MRRTATVLLPALLLSLLLSGCTAPPADDGAQEPASLGFDFGQRLDGWSKDSDLPLDPNVADPDARVDWRIDIVEDKGRGESVRLFLDGSQDDGTIWIERDVAPGPGAWNVKVRIDAWSASESFNTLAYLVSYLGPDDPETEGDFPGPGENSATDDVGHGGLRETLNQAEGWKTYTYNWTTPEPTSDDALWFAVGISAVWETEMTYYVDNVELHFTPA